VADVSHPSPHYPPPCPPPIWKEVGAGSIVKDAVRTSCLCHRIYCRHLRPSLPLACGHTHSHPQPPASEFRNGDVETRAGDRCPWPPRDKKPPCSPCARQLVPKTMRSDFCGGARRGEPPAMGRGARAVRAG